MSGALGLSKSARFPGMNCGRRALLWSPRLRRKRDRFPGASFGRGAAFRLGRGRASIRANRKKTGGSQGTRSGKAKRRLPFTPTAFLPDWTGFGGALQGAGRALTDCPLRSAGRVSPRRELWPARA